MVANVIHISLWCTNICLVGEPRFVLIHYYVANTQYRTTATPSILMLSLSVYASDKLLEGRERSLEVAGTWLTGHIWRHLVINTGRLITVSEVHTK